MAASPVTATGRVWRWNTATPASVTPNSTNSNGTPNTAHYRGSAIKSEFGREEGFVVLRHPDEQAAQQRYPAFAVMSTTVIAFHKLGEPTPAGRPRILVERHGS